MLTKDRQDTLLLILMAMITLAFVLYIFLPSGSKPVINTNESKIEKKETTTPPPIQTKTTPETKKIPVIITLPEEPVPTEEKILEEFDKKLENELTTIFTNILASPPPFKNYDTGNLKTLLLGEGLQLVERLYKYSFFDLPDITRLEFPATYTNALKFNLFESLFLVKIREESIDEAFSSLPLIELEKQVNVDAYNFLGNEIEKDYQLIPILFYLKHLVRQLNLYPTADVFGFFNESLDKLRDLTEAKYLVKIRELLSFSVRREKFQLQWIEEDGIFGNDKKDYKNLNLKVYKFLKQDYLVFPEARNTENNRWIKELCKADPGEIELEFLDLRAEDPSRPLNIQKIIYTPIGSHFVVLLQEYSPALNSEFLNRALKKQIDNFYENYIIIDFSQKETDPKVFKTKLRDFGHYLKKNIPLG